MAGTPNVNRGWKYARQVVAGKIVAGRLVKLACRWMLDDLESSKKKSFPWLFDKDKAERVLHLMQTFHHVKGEWALRGETIHLEDWQCFNWSMVFGWVNRKTNYRRFLLVLLFVARKNAKTAAAATVGLIMLTDDNEYGAEVYSGATSEKQAWEVFGAALEMTKKNEIFKEHYGIEPNASNISIPGTNSKFEPLIGKPGDGPNPSCSLHDEYHEHKTDAQVSTMRTGSASRRQPLQVIITTAGDNTTSPCADLCDEGIKNLEGSLRNDRFFPLMYCRDEGDEWDSITAMKKANPNLGISVFRDYLDQQLVEAKNNPAKQASYRTKHLNEWVGARSAFFNMDKWKQSAQAGISTHDYSEYPCIIGLDLASKIDIAALEIFFLLGPKEYVRFGKYYLPESAVESGVNKNYKTWVDQGWITMTPGNMTDYDFIEQDILELDQQLEVREVAFDPHQATMLITHLQNADIECVEMRPLVLNFSEPMKTMDALIRDRAIKHNGDPVYSWMLSNVTAKMDAKDNVYPRKEREENKIDGPVATIMALARALVAPEEELAQEIIFV